MKKEFEELRAAARCHDILQSLVYDLMNKIDDMGDAIEEAEDRIVDYDLEATNPKAVKELKTNLKNLESVIVEFGKIILCEDEEDESEQGGEE